MKPLLLSICLIFPFQLQAKLKLNVHRDYSMEFLNYDTATPLSSTSFMIKQFGKERNTGVVSVNKIHPMSVLELKKLVKNRTGSENYKIVSVGENNFYYFYSKESVFYYHPLGLLIQHHSKKISPSKIKLVKR